MLNKDQRLALSMYESLYSSIEELNGYDLIESSGIRDLHDGLVYAALHGVGDSDGVTAYIQETHGHEALKVLAVMTAMRMRDDVSSGKHVDLDMETGTITVSHKDKPKPRHFNWYGGGS